jgi:hypothetical protein
LDGLLDGEYAGINPGVENINHENYKLLMYRIKNADQLVNDGICTDNYDNGDCELIIDISTPNQEFEIHLVP